MKVNLQEKRCQERKNRMEKRRDEIIDCAFACFCDKGIEKAALADIAAAAKVGEATLYRYFSTKENLAMDCGIRFWSEIFESYEELVSTEEYQSKTGLAQIEALLELSAGIYEEQESSLKFLHNLDVYMASHKMNEEKMQEYAILVDRAKPFLCDAIEKGKKDQTVTCKADTQEIYYTLTHTVLSLMQKLAGVGQLLAGDSAVTAKRRIQLLLQLLLKGLKD